jgi:hypothetical protein
MRRDNKNVVRRLSTLGIVFALVLTAIDVRGEVLFESGTLGPTGVPWSQLTSGDVPGSVISPTVFTGVRFRLDESAITTQMGGHFGSPANGTFFAAVVALNSGSDFPDSGDLTSSDVLGETLLTFPGPSAEVFSEIHLSLDPGWYALVFGSGLFGASGSGGALANNPDIGNPSYIAFQPLSGIPWLDLGTFITDLRFVVKGRIIPEPSISALLISASLFFLSSRARIARRSATALV